MSSLAYYLGSLGAALLVIAIASGLLARHIWHGQRRVQAVALLDTLARSTDWVTAQGQAVCFQAATGRSDPSLQEIRTAQREWFPELDGAVQQLCAVHRQLSALLQLHEQLRDDADAWLEDGHDATFMALRREHSAIVQAMERQLVPVARAAWPLRHRTFPA